jgi:hypothetical protein
MVFAGERHKVGRQARKKIYPLAAAQRDFSIGMLIKSLPTVLFLTVSTLPKLEIQIYKMVTFIDLK